MKAFVFPCPYSFRPSLSPKLLGNDFKNWRTQLVAVCLLALGSLWSPPKAQAQAVNFGSVNVCSSGATTPSPCSKTMTVSFTLAASETLGTPKVLTLGAPDLDFKLASGSTCTGAVTEGGTCTVNVIFDPLYAGGRNGAVQLSSSSGSIVATTFIRGFAVGPQLAFGPPVQTTLTTKINEGGVGIAVDGGGNVFIAENSDDGTNTGEILKKAPDGAKTTVVSGLAGGVEGVAVDGAGNLWITEYGGNLLEVPTGGGAEISYPLSDPAGVAVDGAGDVFVAEEGDNRVVEFLNGGSTQLRLPFTGLSSPGPIAVDYVGNIYVVDYVGDFTQLLKLPAGGGPQVVVPLVPAIPPTSPDTILPGGLAVDGNGNLFLSDSSANERIWELPVNGDELISVAAGLLTPGLIAVDPVGDIFFTEAFAQNLYELKRPSPPTFSFASTAVGSSGSVDSPQSVLFQNIGNAPLTGTGVLSDDADFVVDPDVISGAVPACTYDLTLAVGAQCSVSFSFVPQSAGPLTSTLTISDNGKPTPAIELSGTGVTQAAKLSATSLQFGNVAYPGTKTLPLTITNISSGALTVSASINGPSYTISSSTCGAGVAVGKSCTMQITFSAAIGVRNDVLDLTLNGAGATVLLEGVSTGIAVTTSPGTLRTLFFQTIPFGTTAVQTVMVTNSGIPGTVMIGTSVNGPSTKILTTAQNTCVAGITSGQSCTLPVEYDPVSVGVHNNIITVTPSAGSAPIPISVLGNANGIYSTTKTLNFGTIPFGTTKVLTLTVTDFNLFGQNENGTLGVGASINGPSYQVLGPPQNTCEQITGNVSCTLAIEFSPVSVGQHTDILTVMPVGASGAPFTVVLEGTAN
jgi:hypothetical protein